MTSHTDSLLAHTEAVARHSPVQSQSVVTIGRLTVDVDARTVKVHGGRVRLTPMEYRVLELLSLGKGTTLTKEMFMYHLYGGMNEPKPRIIDVFVCKLRKKLAAAGGDGYIETLRERGYTLRERTSEEAAKTLDRIMCGPSRLCASDGAGDPS